MTEIQAHMSTARTSVGRRGFALTATILMIAIFVALAAFGIALANQEQRTSFRTGSRATAFYAAEMGLARGLDQWNAAQGAATLPGDTRLLDQGTLPEGASYRADVTRLDDGSAFNPLYLIESEGMAGDGRSQRVRLLATSLPLGLEVKGAARVTGPLRIIGTADVSGFDVAPPLWQDCPPLDTVGLPGIAMTDTTLLDASGGAASYVGQPPLLEIPDTTGLFQFGALSFQDLAGEASITLPPGTLLSGLAPGPSLSSDGSCDTTDPNNWGDPTQPNQPCGGWFPLIYATGDLKLSGSGAGQGILLVEGDLDLSGGVEFFGPVMVKGKVKSTGGGFHFHGALVAGATDVSDQSVVTGNSRIQYSSCVLHRALTLSPPASLVKPLTERPWFQTR